MSFCIIYCVCFIFIVHAAFVRIKLTMMMIYNRRMALGVSRYRRPWCADRRVARRHRPTLATPTTMCVDPWMLSWSGRVRSASGWPDFTRKYTTPTSANCSVGTSAMRTRTSCKYAYYRYIRALVMAAILQPCSVLSDYYRERKCADTIGTVLVPWPSHFQIKYTEQFYRTAVGNLWFEIAAILTAR